MNLHQLLLSSSISLQNVREFNENIHISGIASDSRCVRPGDLFIAISGYETDGHQYINAALKAGAAAVAGEIPQEGLSVPYIQLEDSRRQMAAIAAAFYGHPHMQHKMIGITGTNGKTTTAFILKHILESAGYSCSLIGSVANYINGKWYTASNTTPDSLELQKLLYSSTDEFAVMEVSSHGISQHRVEGVEFDYTLFTNLDRDHLDFHETMDEYFTVKSKLFMQLKKNGTAVINTDSSWGEKLLEKVSSAGGRVLSFGENPQADLILSEWKTSSFPAALFSESDTRGHFVQLSTPGLHNVYNAGLAFLTALEIGIEPRVIQEALMNFPGVPGRNEVYKREGWPSVMLDYAHTAEAIYHCLNTARECGAERVYHVFGFREGRDESKRGDMIRLSSELSDRYVLTSDDLNGMSGEDQVIELKDLQNEHGNHKGSVLADRTLAIREMIMNASPQDWVVVTGKGAEPYKQEFSLPFSSDGETIRHLLNQDPFVIEKTE